MLLRNVVLLVNVPLESSEDVTLLHEVLAAVPLDGKQTLVRKSVCVCHCISTLGRDGEVLELLAQHDDRLFGQQRILCGCGVEVRAV